MSKRDRRASSAPAPFTIGGKSYLLSPPRNPEFLLADRYFRQLALKQVRHPVEAIAEHIGKLPPAAARLAVEAAVALAAGSHQAEPTEEAIRGQLWTAEGCRYWLWLLARPLHPDLAGPEAFADAVTEGNVPDVLSGLLRAFDMDSDESEPESDPGKKDGPAGSGSP